MGVEASWNYDGTWRNLHIINKPLHNNQVERCGRHACKRKDGTHSACICMNYVERNTTYHAIKNGACKRKHAPWDTYGGPDIDSLG